MKRVKVFLDWDGTLTKKDTLLALSNIGYQVNEQDGLHPRPWSEIVHAYLDDLVTHAATYRPSLTERTTVEQESKYLASLKEVEERSIRRVEEAGVFKGVTAVGLTDGARDAVESGIVNLRPGWAPLFELARSKRKSFNLEIISVNWSEVFIRGCLIATAKCRSLDASLTAIRCSANEIQKTGSLTGHADLRTSTDKVERMQRIMEAARKETEDVPISLYVGDSLGDFDALLGADIGICVRDEPLTGSQKELADVLARVGLVVKPLAEAEVLCRENAERQMVVYWVNDLEQVVDFLEKHDIEYA